ncbi:MAG: hypothetical protein ACPG9N_06365, partial [Miltoncostaeaceae bacterium]
MRISIQECLEPWPLIFYLFGCGRKRRGGASICGAARGNLDQFVHLGKRERPRAVLQGERVCPLVRLMRTEGRQRGQHRLRLGPVVGCRDEEPVTLALGEAASVWVLLVAIMAVPPDAGHLVDP